MTRPDLTSMELDTIKRALRDAMYQWRTGSAPPYGSNKTAVIDTAHAIPIAMNLLERFKPNDSSNDEAPTMRLRDAIARVRAIAHAEHATAEREFQSGTQDGGVMVSIHKSMAGGLEQAAEIFEAALSLEGP